MSICLSVDDCDIDNDFSWLPTESASSVYVEKCPDFRLGLMRVCSSDEGSKRVSKTRNCSFSERDARTESEGKFGDILAVSISFGFLV